MSEDKNRRGICSAVAQILQKERAQRGFTLAAVATKAGLSYQMVRFVEQQKRNPTLDTLLRICEALGIRVEDLIAKARKSTTKAPKK
jgi:transcriptional regulator with XRE-family HTH domain